jgi:L-asparaginase II
MGNPVLVNVWRGSHIESSHHGRVVVLDSDGDVIFSLGDIDAPVFPRSSVKAIQALPLIESGAADTFKLTQQEIALACASHSGDESHVVVANSMLTKAGLDVHHLECGAHWPTDNKVAGRLAESGGKPSALHNNCSGKHAGFLCVCCADSRQTQGYVGADHIIQRQIREIMSDVTGAPHTHKNMAIDGCSIPTYAVPLRNLALGFARFGSGHGLSLDRARAAGRILTAIASAPDMIAGQGRFDTEIMKILGSGVMLKLGAEGVYCGTIPEFGIGIALKCDDGTIRAAEVMMAAVLRRLLNNDMVHSKAFEAHVNPILKNWNGIEVARLTPSEVLTS